MHACTQNLLKTFYYFRNNIPNFLLWSIRLYVIYSCLSLCPMRKYLISQAFFFFYLLKLIRWFSTQSLYWLFPQEYSPLGFFSQSILYEQVSAKVSLPHRRLPEYTIQNKVPFNYIPFHQTDDFLFIFIPPEILLKSCLQFLACNRF